MPASADPGAVPGGWRAGTAAAHEYAVVAAIEGMRDPALGPQRVAGPSLRVLAEAAVSSATPYLRAPLLAAVAEALDLHPRDGTGRCGTCGTPAPCATEQALIGRPAALDVA